MLSSVELACDRSDVLKSFHTKVLIDSAYQGPCTKTLFVVAISIQNSQRQFSKNNIIMPVQWHEENLKRLFLAVLAVNRVDIAAVARKWLELYGEYGRQFKSGNC